MTDTQYPAPGTKNSGPCPHQPAHDLSFWLQLGLTPYREAHNLQLRLVQARAEGTLENDSFLMLEHPSVFTLGRRGDIRNLKVPERFLEARGIDVVHAERGGDITYHGPGQLVGYPIIHVRKRGLGIVEYVTALEEVMIRTAGDWGIEAGRNPLNRGVWAGRQKLGSIGIALRRWISFHGFALNVSTDIEPFQWIHPCGLDGVSVTSMAQILGKGIPMAEVCDALRNHVEEVFEAALMSVTLEDLRKAVPSIAEPSEARSIENRSVA